MTTARLDALKWQLEEYGGGLPTSECRELIFELEAALARAERAERALEQLRLSADYSIFYMSEADVQNPDAQYVRVELYASINDVPTLAAYLGSIRAVWRWEKDGDGYKMVPYKENENA